MLFGYGRLLFAETLISFNYLLVVFIFLLLNCLRSLRNRLVCERAGGAARHARRLTWLTLGALG